LDVRPRNPLYLKGNVWALLRKFFSFQLVFPPPPLTICSTVESLPKPFTPLDVSPYSLYHDSLSIPRGQGCLSSSIYVFFFNAMRVKRVHDVSFFQVNIFRPFKYLYIFMAYRMLDLYQKPDVFYLNPS
jgi:hypothetical protein